MNKSLQKKIFLFVCLSTLVLVLSGCILKTTKLAPISADTFATKAQSLSFETESVSPESQQASSETSETVATKDQISVTFFEFNNEVDAANWYQTYQNKLESLAASGAGNTSVSRAGYARYTLKTSDSYYIAIRMVNTVVFAVGPKSAKDDISSLIKSIKY